MNNISAAKSWRDWLSLLRSGDYVVIGVFLLLWGVITPLCWSQAGATRVKIFQDGQLYAELDLAAARTLAIDGPLGKTTIEVAAGRARIASDPSPRQYCVRAGWLTQVGQSAICLPNRTSIELVGQRPASYDSLSY
ncbi:NusG domain II-containing protein [Deefgea piscis]|uniref:NusG domain II-containing protein n=1 Tax=Deefgea piscis TaxID=2739061 RepID=UPI002103A709|nr:NusG domain II-containing protein [Deefgea piscis]